MSLDPKKWQPIEAEPIIPGQMVPPPPTSEKNPYLRTTLPSNLQLQPDLVKQSYTGAIPKIRVMPLQPSANAGANAAAQTVAKTVATNVAHAIVNANPPQTDVDIITGVNRQVFGSLDTSYQTALLSVPGTITSISTTGVASSLNTVALVVGDGTNQVGGSPGAGWTSLGGGGEYWKIVPQGNVTATQTFGSGQTLATQVLCLFRGNGTTPTFTSRGSGTGGASPFVVGTFTPTAGNSLLFINVGGGQFNNNVVVTDSQGNNWQTLQNAFVIDGPVGSSPAIQTNIAYAQNVAGASTSVTITFNSNNSLGNWILYEVTNLLNVSSGVYTFQNSDNDKMVLFTGGANITATLPSPALPAGWQALVVNDSGVGVDTLTPQSGALLNNLTASQTLQPGYFTWILSDGTNYWLTSKVQPQAISKQAHQWLDSYNGATGLYTQSRPAFSDISGNISTGQMNGGSGANSSAYWRGDGTWDPLDWNALNGAAGNAALKYLNVTLAGKGIPSTTAVVDTNNTANVALTTLYATPSDSSFPLGGGGKYRITYYIVLSRAATTSSTLPDIQFGWTDWDTAVAETIGPFDSSTPSTNALGLYYSGEVIIRAKNGTNITYQTGVTTGYASSGATAMQYSIHIGVEAL